MTDEPLPPPGQEATAGPSDRAHRYDAFISYSQRGDRAVARALRSVVQTIGTPWWKVRGLNVFLDATSLSAAPSLWQGIADKLDASRYLILLASPEAAASKWVDREVAHFLARNGADRLLIALTEGELAWDETAGAFRPETDLPLPPALRGRFTEEPLWVDLRPFRRDPATATKGNQAFLHAALDLAATIRGVEKADLYSEEVKRQRRMLRLAYGTAAVVATLAVGAGVAAWIAIQNEARANAEAERALRNFEIARRTVDDVVFDVSQGLREVEGMRTETIRTILGSVETAVSRLSEAAADDTDILRSRGAMLDEFGDTYAAAGDRVSALAAYRESLAIARELSATDPANTLWLRDVGVALAAIGDVELARGNPAEALTQFEAYLDVARELVAIDPANTEWRRDVALALGRIGRARLISNDIDGARLALDESLAIHRGLAETDPGNMLWQRDVATVIENLSGADEADGNLVSASTRIEESIAIARHLTEVDPGNTLRRRDLALRLTRLGDIQLMLGDTGAALASWEESVDIARGLLSIDPESADAQHDLAVGLERLGRARLGEGAVEEALTAFRESLDILRHLSSQDPEDAEAQRVVGVGHQRIGDAETAAGNREAGRNASLEAIGVFRALAGPEPGDGGMALDLAITLEMLGDLERDNDRDAAAAAYAEAVAIRRRQAAAGPDDAARHAALAASLERLGYLQAISGDGAAATATMEDIAATRRRLVELQPGTIDAEWQLGEDLVRLGNLHMVMDDPAAALAAWQENLAVRDRMARSMPDDATVLRRLAGAHANVAFAQLFLRNFGAAETAARQALELAPGETVFETNLAHALMLKGEVEAADRLYLDNRGSDLGGRGWEAVVLEDFDKLRRNGVTDPHMAEIEALYEAPLSGDPSTPVSESVSEAAPVEPGSN